MGVPTVTTFLIPSLSFAGGYISVRACTVSSSMRIIPRRPQGIRFSSLILHRQPNPLFYSRRCKFMTTRATTVSVRCVWVLGQQWSRQRCSEFSVLQHASDQHGVSVHHARDTEQSFCTEVDCDMRYVLDGQELI